jgi:phosphatidylserine decarboxylase
MLGSDVDAARFVGGCMAIFRLAPQDYHRFHFPVAGRVQSITAVPGRLYTVNPIAINSKINVLAENKRAVVIIDTEALGRVAFVAIGATVVGSIVFTAKVTYWVMIVVGVVIVGVLLWLSLPLLLLL